MPRWDWTARRWKSAFPKLVTARMTPFGDDGPWADFKGSDLIHLALGGVMMNCGYDPDPNLEYDTPPIAPQVWHAYHIAGEQLATGIIAALIAPPSHRPGPGRFGRDARGGVEKPRTGHHALGDAAGAAVAPDLPACAGDAERTRPASVHTKDGRWFISHGMGARDLKNLVPLLTKYGMQADLQPPPPDADLKARAVPGSTGRRRSAGAYARRGAALRPRLDLCRHAVAGGAGRRPAMGAAAQAA